MPTNDLASESSPPEVPAAPVRYRHPSPDDGAAMYHLADVVGLDLNSPYAYVMWGDLFSGTSIVAEDAGSGRVVGFVTGCSVPDRPDTLFVWQVGVDPAARGRGIAATMIDRLVERTGATHVEATVTPDNAASSQLFRSVGTRHGAPVQERTIYDEAMFPGGHEAEVLFRIGPLQRQVVSAPPDAR